MLWIVLFSLIAGAGQPDRPTRSESFTQFFQRITSHERYQGIRLSVPDRFAASFYSKILRDNWRQSVDTETNRLSSAIDFDRLPTEQKVWPLLMDSSRQTQLRRAIPDCQRCQSPRNMLNTDWDQLDSREVNALIQTIIGNLRFSGRTLLSHLAAQHEIKLSHALQRMEFMLLNEHEFQIQAQRFGFGSQVTDPYIMGELPGRPGYFLSLVNLDAMKAQTTFKAPVYQLLELVMISLFEWSHMMQEVAANNMGFDTAIHSMDSFLVHQGLAEFTSQQSFNYMAKVLGNKSVASLFLKKRTLQVLTRPDGYNSPAFPFSVGFPYILAEFEQSNRWNLTQKDLIRVIGNQKSLQDHVSDFFR